jgi:hypothetical protein
VASYIILFTTIPWRVVKKKNYSAHTAILMEEPPRPLHQNLTELAERTNMHAPIIPLLLQPEILTYPSPAYLHHRELIRDLRRKGNVPSS